MNANVKPPLSTTGGFTDYKVADGARLGQEIMDKELAFNRAAGFTRADDRVPEFMKYEKLPPHNVVWDVPDETLDAVFWA